MKNMGNLIIIDHPLIQHKLTIMRKKSTNTCTFRQLLKEVSYLLGYEVTRDLKLKAVPIETPLASMTGYTAYDHIPVLIPILRAGLGILDGILELMPTAKVGHIGLYRDENTHSVVEYYLKFPDEITHKPALILDPMLATGKSAVAAVARVKEAKPKSIVLLSLLAVPEGISYFSEHHPDVKVYTAALDERLNERDFIIPGLGDAGDRLFGTQ